MVLYAMLCYAITTTLRARTSSPYFQASSTVLLSEQMVLSVMFVRKELFLMQFLRVYGSNA